MSSTNPDFGWDGAESPTERDEQSADVAVTIKDYDVQEAVTDAFGEETWPVMEAVLATHATILLDNIDRTQALMIEGISGSGKTSLLKTLGNLDQFVRRDNVTPASFVSADSSKSKEELEEGDLLPDIHGRTLVVRDAGPWFTGSRDQVEDMWSHMATFMDGDGHIRQTGTHGTRGYTGVRFNFVGATTPLPPRAWEAMGNVGQRLLFMEWPKENADNDEVLDLLQGGEREPIERVKRHVTEFMRDLWREYDGMASVSPDDEALTTSDAKRVRYLADLVRHGRVMSNGNGDEPGYAESNKRLIFLLRSLAQGRALLYGRRNLERDDWNLAARAALSSVPRKRRELLRRLVDPESPGAILSGEVETLLGVSRKTAHSRMRKLETLGMAHVVERENGKGGATKAAQLNEEYQWPTDLLDFPEA